MKINNKRLEKTAEKFTGLMIKCITEVEKNWTKPWLPVSRKDFLPRNLNGRHYSGGNTLMLLIGSMYYDFRTPVYLTFLQAGNLGIRINKGAQSFPVYHIAYMYCDPAAQDRISIEKYEQLPYTEKGKYYRITTPKCYDVFNLDQTDYSEKYPEEWSELLSRHEPIPRLAGTYRNGILDNMLGSQSWVCPIYEKPSGRAYYSSVEDHIILPGRGQFPDGESFYSIALHEMKHSTGHESRLDRIKKSMRKGTAAYAREELVAELSSALLGYYFGIETRIRNDHASYLKYWLGALHKDNGFLMDVLADVVQAVKYICLHLDYNPFEKAGVKNGIAVQAGNTRRCRAEVAVSENELVVVD